MCLLLSSTTSDTNLASIRLPDVILQVQTFGMCVRMCICVFVFKWPWKLLCVNKCQHSRLYRFTYTNTKYVWVEKNSSGDTMCWFFQLKCGDGDKLHMRSCVLLCVFAHFAYVCLCESTVYQHSSVFSNTHTHTWIMHGTICVCVCEVGA